MNAENNQGVVIVHLGTTAAMVSDFEQVGEYCVDLEDLVLPDGNPSPNLDEGTSPQNSGDLTADAAILRAAIFEMQEEEDAGQSASAIARELHAYGEHAADCIRLAGEWSDFAMKAHRLVPDGDESIRDRVLRRLQSAAAVWGTKPQELKSPDGTLKPATGNAGVEVDWHAAKDRPDLLVPGTFVQDSVMNEGAVLLYASRNTAILASAEAGDYAANVDDLLIPVVTTSNASPDNK